MPRRRVAVCFTTLALLALVGVGMVLSRAPTVTSPTPTAPPRVVMSHPPPLPPWDTTPGQTLAQNAAGIVAIKSVVITNGQIILFYAAQTFTPTALQITVTATQRECVSQPAPATTQTATVIPLGRLDTYDVGAIRFAYADLPGQVLALDITASASGIAAPIGGGSTPVGWHLEPIRQIAPDMDRNALSIFAPYSPRHDDAQRPELPAVVFVTRSFGIHGGNQMPNTYTTGGYFQLTTGSTVPVVFVMFDAQGNVAVTDVAAYTMLAGTAIPTPAPFNPLTPPPYPPTLTPLGFVRQPIPARCKPVSPSVP